MLRIFILAIKKYNYYLQTLPFVTIFYKSGTKIVTSYYNNFKQIIMKTKYLLLVLIIAALTSCSTIYKTGQTPDDVYYSPARAISTGNNHTDESAPEQYGRSFNDQGLNFYSAEDRMIRMGINDSRYRYLDNNYGYSPYNYSYGNNYGYGHNSGRYYYDNNFNPYYTNSYYGNYYYNPYYSTYPVYIVKDGPLKTTTPRTTNLSGYGKNYNNNNGTYIIAPHPNNNTNSRAKSSGLGNFLNKIVTPANNNSNNTIYTPTQNSRTYTPAPTNNNSNSSSNNSSSGSSKGGGQISRPH